MLIFQVQKLHFDVQIDAHLSAEDECRNKGRSIYIDKKDIIYYPDVYYIR